MGKTGMEKFIGETKVDTATKDISMQATFKIEMSEKEK